jgi:8-oxo-dGTP diphosphatase
MKRWIDRAFQIAFWGAHRLLRVTWLIRRPRTSGALVALWHGDRVLLVKNSYRTQYTLPGGYVKPHESEAEAGARELMEEVHVVCEPARLKRVYEGEHPFEFRRDALVILEADVAESPIVQVDNREVVWAGFKSRKEALALPIVPHLREYLSVRRANDEKLPA